MYFDMYGPFEVARVGGSVLARQTQMWAAVRKGCAHFGYEETELERAIGCYAFGLKVAENDLRPWYIGMTTCDRGFRGEVFQKHKRDHYDTVLRTRRGEPVMFLMPLLTPEGRFSRDRGTAKPLIQWVEKMLFGVALRVNPHCRNQRDTKFLREVQVRGVFNHGTRGPPGPAVTAARRMFGTE